MRDIWMGALPIVRGHEEVSRVDVVGLLRVPLADAMRVEGLADPIDGSPADKWMCAVAPCGGVYWHNTETRATTAVGDPNPGLNRFPLEALPSEVRPTACKSPPVNLEGSID